MNNVNNEADNIVQYPEKIPGTFESYHKISSDFEYASNALCALGDLMVNTEYGDLEEFTVQGLGYLLKILGNDLCNTSFEVLDIAGKAREQKEMSASHLKEAEIETS